VTGSGSTMDINRLTMSNNENNRVWNGIVASAGAEVTLTNSVIEGNTNLRVS